MERVAFYFFAILYIFTAVPLAIIAGIFMGYAEFIYKCYDKLTAPTGTKDKT